MKDIINGFTERFRQEHTRARRYVAMMLVLALLTTLFVNWQLHGVGISMTADYHCGYEEHQHTEACYEKVLTCGYEEGEPETVADTANTADTVAAYSMEEEPEETEPETILVPHTHTDECYEERQILTCFEEEHTHDDDCFDEYGALICDQFEHTHDDSCYTTEYDLVCGLDEGELVEEENPAYIAPVSSRPVVIDWPAETDPEEPVLHTHTDACYTEELVCTIPEHHHTVECLADEQADVETAEEWQAAANVTLTGSWAEDLLTVAKSQLDYQQSEKNFKLDVEDQQVLRGYSRYGAWYGNPYGAWDVMFLSYCLHFAGVPQSVVPQRAGVLALHSELRGSAWLTDADGTTAKPGDIVIYNTLTTEQVTAEDPYGIALLSLDGEEETEPTTTEPQIETRTVSTETVGVVSAVENGTLTVISGNVDGKVAEVSISTADVTSVISVTGAYAAEGSTWQPVSTGSDAVFSITADWEDGPALLDLASDEITGDTAASGGIWLDSHIKSVSLATEVDGKETPIESGSEVKDGEKVFVQVNFDFQEGELTQNNNIVYYQLPGGLTLTEPVENGVIKNENNEDVGRYTIDEKGLVTMTFDPAFSGFGAALDGKLKFEAVADRSKAEDGKVTIGGETLIIKQDPDLAITKVVVSYEGKQKWSDAEGNFYVYWQVEVTTKKGSGGPVTIEDILMKDGALPASHVVDKYLELVKYDKDNNAAAVAITENTYVLSEDGRTLTFKDLPELKEGERYVLRYATKVAAQDVKDLYATSKPNIQYNQAIASAEDVEAVATDWKKITFNRDIVSKKGTPNGNGQIEWSITISAPQDVPGGLLQGYTISDAWPAKDSKDLIDLVGDIQVEIQGETRTTATITKEQLLNGVKVSDLDPDAKAYKITLTYTTTVPAGGGEVTNVAHVTDDGHDYKSTAKVDVTAGVWTLTKTHTGDDDGKALWSIDASNPTGANSFELRDHIPPTTTESGESRGGVHYALAAELQAAMEKNLQVYETGNATPLSYAQAVEKGYLTVEYLDVNDKEVDSTDGTTPVSSFCISVDTGSKDARVSRVVFPNIPTHEDRDQMTGVWTFLNRAELWQGGRMLEEAEAEDTGYGEDSILKEVSADGELYNDENGSISYSELEQDADGNRKLYYKVTLIATAPASGQIDFADILPASVTCPVNGTDMTLKIDGKQISWYDSSTWTLTQLPANGGKIGVRVKGLTPDKQYKIEFAYHVTLDQDAWENKFTTEVAYTNTATWGSKNPSSITTTVTRALNPLIKTGEQLMDSNNAWTNQIRYTVIINPYREKLGDGQWLTLKDTITVPEGVSVYGDMSSVKLYYYNDQGTALEVDPNLYYKLDPDDDCWLKLQVPDRTALKLEYICTIDRGDVRELSITNAIKTEGYEADTNRFPFKINTSEATITRGQLVINKLDSASRQLLPGAVFKVQRYDTVSRSFVDFAEDTTDANGQLVLGITELTDATLSPDVLYRVVETQAPANYSKDATPHYLLFYKAEESKADAFAAATGEESALTFTDTDGTLTTVDLDKITVGSSIGTTVLDVENTYNRLTVYKYWFDENTNQPLAAEDVPVDSIQLQLYRYKKGQSKEDAVEYGSAVTLTPDEDGRWAYTWEGETQIPAKDTDGSEYYYFVKELTTGNWVVTDANNDGVQTGTVVLRNTVYAGRELPSTGGMGTAPFGVLGGAMAAAAALLLARKRKHHANEEE